jgi:hypothetical protein
MLLSLLQFLLAMLLLFFLPGFTLVNFLFPRKGELDREFDMLYRVILGIGMSIAISIFVGFGLDALGLGPSGFGYITSQNIWILLFFLTVLFFVLGWFLGAYPILGRLHPKLLRVPKGEPVIGLKEEKTLQELQTIAKARQKLRFEIEECERKTKIHASSEMRRYYENKRKVLLSKLEHLNMKIRELEQKRSKELYGVSNRSPV